MDEPIVITYETPPERDKPAEKLWDLCPMRQPVLCPAGILCRDLILK